MKKPPNSSVAYTYIKRAILEGKYSGGQALYETELATQIGLSRTPVREALKQLEAEGLVSIRARMGAVVKTMSLNEFREICEVRQSLEVGAAGLAALHHDAKDLEEIRAPLERMAASVRTIAQSDSEPPDALKSITQDDIRFHLAILSSAKNEVMKREILRLHLLSRVVAFVHPDKNWKHPHDVSKAKRDVRRGETLLSHEAIFHALAARDASASKRAMEEHIQEVIDLNLLNLFRSNSISKKPAPADADLDLAYVP